MKTVIAHARSINSLADLQRAVQHISDSIPMRVAAHSVTLIDTLKLKLIEETLTDGSKVYDVQLLQDD